jgi:hypothetical protein
MEDTTDAMTATPTNAVTMAETATTSSTETAAQIASAGTRAITKKIDKADTQGSFFYISCRHLLSVEQSLKLKYCFRCDKMCHAIKYWYGYS